MTGVNEVPVKRVVVDDIACEVFDLGPVQAVVAFCKDDVCWTEVVFPDEDRNLDEVVMLCMSMAYSFRLKDEVKDGEILELIRIRSLFLLGISFMSANKPEDAMSCMLSAQGRLEYVLSTKMLSSMNPTIH